MISFESDYNNGAHPKVLQRLLDTNALQSKTYGYDEWSHRAKERIRQICETPDADIWFLTGGTQTNATVIDGTLAPYEGVIAADTGHINTHEAGAIEAFGHKVITLPSHEGKIDARELETFMRDFEEDGSREHCVQPGMVYISYPTELGTLYSKREMEDIHTICQRHQLTLFVDGARLGYGLTAPGADMSFPQFAAHCDVFYIGGTKVGALCGEAVVFPRRQAPKCFFSIVKRHGALLAKSRLTGIQFDALFTDNLYLEISRHAIDMAMRMKEDFQRLGVPFYIDSPTNQQFVILPDQVVAQLKDEIAFTHWSKYDGEHTVCRLVTSWATREEDIATLRERLEKYLI